GTGTGMLPGGGICDTGLTIDGGAYDGCLDVNCCTTMQACYLDPACLGCMQHPNGLGCNQNQLYQGFTGCFDVECPTSICSSGVGYMSPALNACLSNACCTEHTACLANGVCAACQQNSGSSLCLTNAPFQAYQACRDTACPEDICGTSVTNVISYGNATEVDYAGNLCAGTYCCAEMEACADPSSNGNPPGDTELTSCIACLAGSNQCPGGSVLTAANTFETCYMANCP
ncbi:MAG: hypothetical protein KC731_36960, partial [Myxococcales bacterium]|nr:hypothetical protein [Myxococcales bacterium]